MEFALSDEEGAFRDAVRRFGDRVLRPNEARIDTEGRIPSEVLKAMADLGLLAMLVPAEFGGMGASAILTELAAEEVGRGDLSMATAVFFLLEAGWGWLLSRKGRPETARAVLPAVCKGEAFLGIATTEPGGGSDLSNLKTTALRGADEFVLKGEKTFISGVEEAKALGGGHITLARDAGGAGFHLLYVPANSPGIATQRFENMGRMGISTGSLSYDSVRVPSANLIGPEGKGLEIVMEGFRVARTFVAAACVGAAERALEAGSAYIKERTAFGQPLGKYEGIQFELVDLYVGIEAVKWQCRRAAWLLDQHVMGGGPARHPELDRAVAAVKLTAPPMAFDTIRKVMAWFGAAGYTKDLGLERGLRGIMSYMVGAEGGLNIMRIILGRELLGPEFVPYK